MAGGGGDPDPGHRPPASASGSGSDPDIRGALGTLPAYIDLVEGSELEEVTRAILDAFLERFRAAVSFEVDRELADDLRNEARPAAQALHFATSMDTAHDETSLDHHEGMAMVSLLGRRAALRGATPMGALRLVPALLDALVTTGAPEIPDDYASMLSVSCIEGFVRGREERLATQIAEEAARAIPTLRVSEGVLALVLAGDHEAAVLQHRGAELARELFATEGVGAVIDVSRLLHPDRSRGAAVLETIESIATIGAASAVSGMTETWREIMDELDGSKDVAFFEHFDQALAHVLAANGHSIRPRLDARIRRLWKG